MRTSTALMGGAVLSAAAAMLWKNMGRKSSPGVRAHRADGSDDSASFSAGIADEGTIPDSSVETGHGKPVLGGMK